MKKYGGDKVQGVADIEKLCSSLLPTAPSQRAAKLRSRHQCRCMIWSSNHVMATNFQTGWIWMNPSYDNPGTRLSHDSWWTSGLAGNSFQSKLLVRESIKLLFLTQLVHCKLQERAMCTFHFRAKHEPHPNQDQTLSFNNDLVAGNSTESFRNEKQRSLPIVSTFFDA